MYFYSIEFEEETEAMSSLAFGLVRDKIPEALWTRIVKLLRTPGIDSTESIPSE